MPTEAPERYQVEELTAKQRRLLEVLSEQSDCKLNIEQIAQRTGLTDPGELNRQLLILKRRKLLDIPYRVNSAAVITLQGRKALYPADGLAAQVAAHIRQESRRQLSASRKAKPDTAKTLVYAANLLEKLAHQVERSFE